MIELKNVSKSFMQGEHKVSVIDNLSIEFKTPSSIAIVGKSGSGKSTMMSLLGGLDQVDGGEILVSGTNICALSETELTNFRASNIGIVFQNFYLVKHLTALENVMLPLEAKGLKDGIKQKALALLEQMDLSHRANHLPSELSGGECQRVAIARALITDADIILADEPSGNLDVETGKKVMSYLFNAVKENSKGLILVTHDLDYAWQCDEVYTLGGGKLTRASNES